MTDKKGLDAKQPKNSWFKCTSLCNHDLLCTDYQCSLLTLQIYDN